MFYFGFFFQGFLILSFNFRLILRGVFFGGFGAMRAVPPWGAADDVDLECRRWHHIVLGVELESMG